MTLFDLPPWLGGRRDPRSAERRRLVTDAPPETIYAIGDVHGHLDLLRELERRIVADAEPLPGRRMIVMLGDYVDRGPHSAQVIDHLIAPPPEGFERVCLAGNHDLAMADFLARPDAADTWLHWGGLETLASYGIPASRLEGPMASARKLHQLLDSHVPTEHREFLSGLTLSLETPDHYFVHAGVRPGVALDRQSLDDLIFFRDDFAATYDEFDKTIVHGHTVRSTPLLGARRIAIDTGAYATGRLTAVRLRPRDAPHLLVASLAEGGD